MRILHVLLLMLVALPSVGWAAEPAPVDTFGALLKMLAALGVVVGMLLLFFAAYKKGFGFLPGVREGQIKVVESRPLGGRKFLCRVEVKGQELLLGVTNDRIELLKELGEVEPSQFAKDLQQAETSA